MHNGRRGFKASLASKEELVMLSTSKVLSFIDNKNGFMLYFFEGQKLIHDLAILHNLKGEGFHFLRDSILGTQLLSVFLKNKENYGFYLDSEEPYFRFKIETNFLGYMRTLLLPEDFNKFPDKISGVYRVSKITEGSRDPYNTIINIENKGIDEIVNQFYRDSFQINGNIHLSKTSDQSVFLMKLPEKNVDKVDATPSISIKDYWDKINPLVEKVFSEAHNDQGPIEKAFTQKDFIFLGSKDIQLRCSCSRERMLLGIIGLVRSSGFEELMQGDKELETKCDYCKTYYLFPEEEIKEKLKDV
ncbi:MAG: molecular chaperone Hsp33 [Bacteriovoracaceae bacterium]